MKIYNLQFKFLAFFGLFLISYFLFLTSCSAQQSPQFFVSWQANSFVPSWYEGKVFPTTGSRISIKFDLIDKGIAVDLSKTTARWYINDKLVINEKNGLGIKSYSFVTNGYAGKNLSVRISIPNYNGSVLDKVIDIPIVSPEVVINAPYSSKMVSSGKLSFEAIPFFFNISDISKLSFLWNANSQPTSATGNPFLNLNIDAVSGSKIDLGVLIKNISNELETASKNIKLMVQ